MNKAVYSLISNHLEGDSIAAFDVGAKNGVFDLHKIKDFITYFGFEPNIEEFNKLQQKTNTTYFPFAIGIENGKKDFHLTKNSSYSSFLQLDQQNFEKHFGLMKDFIIWKEGMEIKETISIEVQSLDNILLDKNIERIDFLKLDTQGTELDIMKGALNALTKKKIGVIFAEFNFLKIYKNQNTFSELDIFLNQNGYECIDCRFYPNAIEKFNINLNRNRVYDIPKFSSGGDAVFIPNIENSDLKQKEIFKIGLLLAQLGYLSFSEKILMQCELNRNEIVAIFKYLHPKSLKKIAIDFIPPIIFKVIKTFRD